MELSTSFALAIVVALCAAGTVYFVLRARIDALSRRVAFVGTAVTACADSIASCNAGAAGQPAGTAAVQVGGADADDSEYETETDDDGDGDGGENVACTVRMVQISAPAPDMWPPVQAIIVEEEVAVEEVAVEEIAVEEADDRRVVSDDEEESYGTANVVLHAAPDEAEETENDAEETENESEGIDEDEDDEARRKRYEGMTKDALKRLVSDGHLASNPSRLLKHQLVDVLVDVAERG